MSTDRLLSSIASKVKQGECILFLGAAVHAGPPEDSPHVYPEELRPSLAGHVVEDLSRLCDFKRQFPADASNDLQRVALCAELSPGLGRKWLVDYLSDKLMARTKPSPMLHLLAQLPFKLIVTTNYDSLFETALTMAGKRVQKHVYCPRPNTVTRDILKDPTAEQPVVFKMHGDLDVPESIVITDEDYIQFVQRIGEKEKVNPVPGYIRQRMQMWPMLFMGYSLRDYNLRLLFRTLRWDVDRADDPGSYSVDRSPDPLILKVWQDERRFVTFLVQDLWSFVPQLHGMVMGAEVQA
jgi:hypothetical protein